MTNSDKQQRLTALVSGHVQGVGYRYFVQRRARDMDLWSHGP